MAQIPGVEDLSYPQITQITQIDGEGESLVTKPMPSCVGFRESASSADQKVPKRSAKSVATS